MKLVFAGTPDFAASSLAALIAAGHEIVVVLTQPDRPAGRGLRMLPSPVKALAHARGIPVLQPMGLRIAGRYDGDARLAHERLGSTRCDAMVVAAYGLILPPTLLAMPPHGCINVHASLLPRWRGAAPVQRAIEAGDVETGITIMQMDAGLDTGPMLLTRSIPITPTDTAATLTASLAVLGGEAIVEALPGLQAGTLLPMPQHAPGDASKVTYAARLSKAEAPIDFTQASRQLVDRMRAFDPWPGCTAQLGGAAPGAAQFRLWHARVLATEVVASSPGQVLGVADDGAVVVASGDGAIALTELQKPGGRRLPARNFIQEFSAKGLQFITNGS